MCFGVEGQRHVLRQAKKIERVMSSMQRKSVTDIWPKESKDHFLLGMAYCSMSTLYLLLSIDVGITETGPAKV